MLIPIATSLLAASGPGSAPPPETVTLSCDAGPVERTFAGKPWLVHSCSDGLTLIIIAPGKGSVDEFVYTVRAEKGGTSVGGSGPGGGRDIAATTQELRRLTAADIAALVAATRAGGPGSRAPLGKPVDRR